MLRVGLTGDLGSGKSTVARLLAAHGAIVFSSDEIGREMMQPGHAVYQQIVDRFGPTVLNSDSTLNRTELARLAFAEDRVEELNSIVHPAVIAEQARRIDHLRATHPHAIVVIESALIFSTRHSPSPEGWRSRFDTIVLVTAPEAVKIQRFIDRAAAGRTLTPQDRAAVEADARRRLAAQTIHSAQAAECRTLINDGTLDHLEHQVNQLWTELQHLEAAAHP